jgi:hypothetical protein
MSDSNESKASLKGRRKILLGLTSGTALAVWQKPVINSIVMPAHAQTSPVVPVDPAALCPMILIGNVIFGPVSGANTPPVCSVTFDVLSGTAGTPLTITSITNSTLAANNTVVYDTFGEATDTAGPRVVWRGPASDAPFCSDLMPIDAVTFTVTATCAAVPTMETFTQDFALVDILA